MTICEGCNQPITDARTSGPGRKRRYHDENCRQFAFRRREAEKARQARLNALQQRWGGLSLPLQELLETVFNVFSQDLAAKLAQAILTELGTNGGAAAAATINAVYIAELEEKIAKYEQALRLDNRTELIITLDQLGEKLHYHYLLDPFIGSGREAWQQWIDIADDEILIKAIAAARYFYESLQEVEAISLSTRRVTK
jgi:hypothetical protein